MSWVDFNSRLDGRYGYQRTICTVAGTSAKQDEGPPADIASWLIQNTPFWRWYQTVYPAATFPMGDSVNKGVENLAQFIERSTGELALDGYSQGAIVVFKIWRMMQPGGRLAAHRDRLKIVVTHGNPCREMGVANGNKAYGWPMLDANSRGIAPEEDRMKAGETPDWWYDFAHKGDIYTDTPNNDIGEDMTMIYRVVQNPTGLIVGKDSGIEQLQELLTSPIREVPAAIGAIFNGLRFVTTSPWPTYPHTSYDVGPAIDLLEKFGRTVPILQGI